MTTFEGWLVGCGLREQLRGMHMIAAFEVMVARLDGAIAAGAKDPMRAISTRAAGPNSRLATRRMLEQLGYSPAQRRIVHRLLAGSPSGWPGLLRLFAAGAALSPSQRRYVARQASDFRHATWRLVAKADVSGKPQEALSVAHRGCGEAGGASASPADMQSHDAAGTPARHLF